MFAPVLRGAQCDSTLAWTQRHNVGEHQLLTPGNFAADTQQGNETIHLSIVQHPSLRTYHVLPGKQSWEYTRYKDLFISEPFFCC